MQIGFVGLGRMGGNMARRLARNGVEVIGYDTSAEAREAVANDGVDTDDSLASFVAGLDRPRIVWLMVPSGAPTESTLSAVTTLLSPDDIVVDGGNAFYKDSQRRGAELAERQIRFIDCGVSGGVWGLENGYALMYGGDPEPARVIEPIIKLLAPTPNTGWLHCGPTGSGHFVKMIHNGIEYGMMQAFAEGLAVLKEKREFALDLAAVTEMWRHGSVVRSWLLDLTAEFLKTGADLADIAPVVADSGEGRWTALEAIELGIPAPVMSLSLMMRFASQGKSDYADKLLAMMRRGFGGHAVQKEPA
jgi:6-phosphogluconate dehydrogenase